MSVMIQMVERCSMGLVPWAGRGEHTVEEVGCCGNGADREGQCAVSGSMREGKGGGASSEWEYPS